MCPSLGLEQVQQIQLTPEVRLGIQVMAMPVLDLHALISNRAMENPFLHMEEAPRGNAVPLEEFDGIAARTPDRSTSLETELLTQLKMDLRDPLDIRIAEMLLRGLDERGYLHMDTDIVADILKTSPNHVERILKKMQTECTPAGIGARSLQECLLAQLSAANDDDPLTRLIVESHLQELADGHLKRVANAVGASPKEVQCVLERIRRLDPHPAACFEREAPLTIPEAIVVHTESGWALKMRRGFLPRIMVDDTYANALDDPTIDERAANRLREMLREAQGLIRAVDLRKAAVATIASAVVRHQSQFFDVGPAGLRPLAMADVAQMTGLSEATVSRVANSVTLDTPKGILDLRYFFHSGVGGSAVEDDASSLAVKQVIQELVNAEDKRHPLSDAKIVDLLEERGMHVSRRTVNKYRTALGILSRSKRRIYA